MRPIVFSLIVFFLLGPSGSFAQTPAPSQEAMDQARERYQQAETLFHVGKFEEAVTLYKEAYELSSAPGLLFNIAQAYRLDREHALAIRYYQSYLRLNPAAENKEDVQRWIAESETARDLENAKIERQKKQELLEKPVVTPLIEPVPPIESEREKGLGSLKISGLATAGFGVLLAGGAGYFAYRADSAWSDINALSDDRGTWSPTHQNRYDGAERDETISTVLFVGGGVAVATGALLYILGMGDSSAETLTLRPHPGGAALGMAW